MAKPRRSEAEADRQAARQRRGVGSEQHDPAAALVRAGRLRPATRRLHEVLAERGPLTGPVTDAGTRALLAVRGDAPDGKHGKR
jgi:hypothetical protein